MNDVTDLAVLTLSKEMTKAATAAVGSAHFVRFYRGQIVKRLGDMLYRVAIDDCLAEMPVYGDVTFKAGDWAWIVSPDNSKEFNRMFILGVSSPNGEGISTGAADHDLLMKVIHDCDDKLSKGAVVQTTGTSTTNVMSQKAVTDAIEALQKRIGDIPKGIQAILVDQTTLTPDKNGLVSVPIATENSAGIVRSSDDQNYVAVDADGTMSISSLDLMRVDQASDNQLILDGGTAAG